MPFKGKAELIHFFFIRRNSRSLEVNYLLFTCVIHFFQTLKSKVWKDTFYYISFAGNRSQLKCSYTCILNLIFWWDAGLFHWSDKCFSESKLKKMNEQVLIFRVIKQVNELKNEELEPKYICEVILCNNFVDWIFVGETETIRMHFHPLLHSPTPCPTRKQCTAGAVEFQKFCTIFVLLSRNM